MKKIIVTESQFKKLVSESIKRNNANKNQFEDNEIERNFPTE